MYSLDECLFLSVRGIQLGQAETRSLPLGSYSLKGSQTQHPAVLVSERMQFEPVFLCSLALSKQSPGNLNPSQSLSLIHI